jgi:two-component system, LytTR family, response regulator LytT
MKITCLAIDDETLALKQLCAYIDKTPFLQLVSACPDAFDAMAVLKETPVEVLFIDINMPDLSGMDFVKSLTEKPYIVFTTAYSEYAVEGFRVDAVDYLLKPVGYADFLKAANKVKALIDLKTNNLPESIAATPDHLFVKSDYKLIRIELANIKYIESMHEYIKIHLVVGKPVMTMLSMKAIEEHLPAAQFMRVHRSYIVNLSKISVVERSRIVFEGDIFIPVTEQYKPAFQSYIDKNHLS